MDETMETVQGDIESAWSAEDPAGEAEGTESAAAADQPKGGEETPPAEPKAPDAPVAQPELFTLKNRDETRQVTRDELVAMAQKGWDYDHVRQERDQLRQYRQEADPALELVKSYAQRNGMSVGDYLDYCRKQELIATGMNEQDAAARVSMEKERADLARQRAEIQAYQDQQNSVLKHAQQQAQARKQDIEAFYQSYPGVDPKSIPPEVWGAVRGGDTLTNAYTRWENKRLQAELAAARQNKANRDKTPGSLGGDTADDNAGLISKYWDEAD